MQYPPVLEEPTVQKKKVSKKKKKASKKRKKRKPGFMKMIIKALEHAKEYDGLGIGWKLLAGEVRQYLEDVLEYDYCGEIITQTGPKLSKLFSLGLIDRDGKPKKYRYFVLDEDSSSEEEEVEDKRVRLRDMDEIIKQDYLSKYNSEKQLKRKRDVVPKDINNKTSQIGNFGGISSRQLMIQVPQVIGFQPMYNLQERPTKRRKFEKVCNHMFAPHEDSLFCKKCGDVKSNVFNK